MTTLNGRGRSGPPTAICVAALTLAVGVAPATPAASVTTHAPTGHHAHYYFELGGTGAAAPAPTCTNSYRYANQTLHNAVAIPVCYPAGAGPWVSGTNQHLDAGAPSYDISVQEGYANLLGAVETTYRADPHARYTIVGYSQGAQSADEALRTIAEGRTDIPRSQVDGMLYADPMQPVTGIEAVVPKGSSIFGFTSVGPGPTDFPGIDVERFCIRTDDVCDMTSPMTLAGFFAQHPRYPRPGGIISQTLSHDGSNGIAWYPPGS